ncbi:MAG: cystathionine gamma-synthase [Wenzhouxiangellaceae bacterium]|nr:cystathionine gamma-synthase [Wenzhouxiangellaceae bacterium]
MPAEQSSLQTLAARAGIESDTQYGAVVPPLHLSSTYSFAGFGQPRAHDYSRSGNPTRDLLADALAGLEGGAACTVTGTGMSAITTALHLVPAGGRLVVAADCYGGTWRLIDALERRGAFSVDWVDFHDPEAWRAALARPADMVWLETPSNPLLRISDIAAISDAAHAAGALVVADNTFLSPVLQQPIKLGADLVVHSTTKYINGHSDVLGGAVIAADAELGAQVAWWANCLGVTAAAFDCWQTLRGLRTLDVRLERQQRTAQALAERLQGADGVARVHYPGLTGHAQHELAARQQAGFGAIVSVELEGGEAAVRRFVDGLGLFSLAESLGGVESLIAHPATMTHAAMSAEARARAGLGDGLLRLSIGLEHVDELAADLELALARACSADAPALRFGT